LFLGGAAGTLGGLELPSQLLAPRAGLVDHAVQLLFSLLGLDTGERRLGRVKQSSREQRACRCRLRCRSESTSESAGAGAGGVNVPAWPCSLGCIASTQRKRREGRRESCLCSCEGERECVFLREKEEERESEKTEGVETMTAASSFLPFLSRSASRTGQEEGESALEQVGMLGDLPRMERKSEEGESKRETKEKRKTKNEVRGFEVDDHFFRSLVDSFRIRLI